jgi:heavy metal translocating P-type ATPase
MGDGCPSVRRMSLRPLTLSLFLASVACLVAGAVLAALDHGDAAGIAWRVGTAIVLASLLVIIAASLLRGNFGLDIVAALSMGGSLYVGEYLAGNVIALMCSGGNLLEDFAEGRAKREMTALLARVPRTAQRYGEDRLDAVPLEVVAPGDRLLVRPGDVVPVDGTVDLGDAVLDEAALTGEPLPATYPPGSAVMSGSTNAGGSFDMTATRSAAESTYAGIVRLVESAQASRAPMARLADRYALGFLALTVGLAAATWLATGDQVRTLAVLVVATPCPLILAVPVAIVAGMSRCAGRGVLVKNAGALEAMARVRTLLLDKTGTLTGGMPRIVAVEPAKGHTAGELLRLAGSLAQASPHVVSVALAAAARSDGLALEAPRDVAENHGAGTSGTVGGHRVALGTREHVAAGLAATAGDPGEVPEPGSLSTYVSVDGRLAGVIVMADEVRAEAAEALAAVRREGVNRVVVVTGDRRDVAEAVTAGLPVDRIVADASPARKVDVVIEESRAALTMMVGDGVNDAPALAAAGVGLAMGARGAAASAEAADAVVLVDSLDRVPVALRIARQTRAIAVQSVLAGIGMSVAGMLAAAFGWLSPLQGALIQEAIDVTVIVYALRAYRG